MFWNSNISSLLLKASTTTLPLPLYKKWLNKQTEIVRGQQTREGQSEGSKVLATFAQIIANAFGGYKIQ